MKTEEGHQCDVCDRLAQKTDTFFEFILPPMPPEGPDKGRIFPGVGFKREGRERPELAILLCCDGCQKRVVDYVRTGEPMRLPAGRLRRVLVRIALKRPYVGAYLPRFLAPEREPDHNPMPGSKPKDLDKFDAGMQGPPIPGLLS